MSQKSAKDVDPTTSDYREIGGGLLDALLETGSPRVPIQYPGNDRFRDDVKEPSGEEIGLASPAVT